MNLKAYTTDLTDNIEFNYSVEDEQESQELLKHLRKENLVIQILLENCSREAGGK